MQNPKPVAHILDLHIVRDNVSLNPSWEFLPHFRIGIKHERSRFRGNENIRIHLSLGTQDGSLNGEIGSRFSQVVADLTVEEAKGVRSRNAELYALREVKKRVALWIGKLRHEGRFGKAQSSVRRRQKPPHIPRGSSV